jgi:arginyl-tRNA--protein-N-Asp/Glu arginylyltransferase
MDYKARFNPVEVLRSGGWSLMAARDRSETEA